MDLVKTLDLAKKYIEEAKVLAIQKVPSNISKKAALLIGINYYGTSSELGGCINDVSNVRNLLLETYKFDSKNILYITDDPQNLLQPTKKNILEGIKWLVAKNKQGFNELWVHYSGHGSYVRDKSKDEKDRRDECLVPVDSNIKGFITDDVILKTLFVPLTKDTRCIALMDACHSGTLADLRYKYISGNKNSIENKKSCVKAKILLLSGCKDKQTSDDSVFDNVWNGAMTKYFLDVLKSSGYSLTCYSLLRKLRRRLRKNGHTQIPQITCSRRIRGSTIFSDNEPNRNAFIS